MARPSLSTASKSRAKKVVDKIAGRKSAESTPTIANKTPVPAQIATTNTTGFSSSVTVPGLVGITPDAVAGMLPQFQESSYAISDPLNPPETLPQVTESTFDKGMRIYEGTQRALKLTGAAFDTTRERFTVIGKQAKAFGAGIKAATEFERVKGDYIDHLGQLETNKQKNTSLRVSQHKTTTDSTAATHKTADMDEKLLQAEIAANLARETTKDKQNKLDEFKKSLGEYAA